MNKTKIDWADMTWNPVTGCLHGCEYCYARKIANRFAPKMPDGQPAASGELHSIWNTNIPFSFGFDPTFHHYRLADPEKIKKPQTIFVCSMADLFGEWVPDEWIQEVFNACKAASKHRYLFLTKNPDRIWNAIMTKKLHVTQNMWFGFSVEDQATLNKIAMRARWLPQNSFISIEPLHGPIDLTRIEPTGIDASLDFLNGGQYWLMGGDDKGKKIKWVIVGAETGNRKDKVIPEKKWIDDILAACVRANVPIFMKESLRDLMGEDFIQMYPWEAGA